MKTKFFSVLITCFIVVSVFSQSNLNDYKYVIVPNKFDFLKEQDQYQLNSLTKFLFNKYGFEAIMEGDVYPVDLGGNRCLALRSDVLKESGMFKTKLTVELKDCNDQVVYTSVVGESREKEYKKSYVEALRQAFKSIESLNYSYVPNKNSAAISTVKKEATHAVEIEKLKKEIITLKEAEKVVVETRPIAEKVIKKSVEEVKTIIYEVKEAASNVLYAQAIENGFQLVDSSPKVVYKIKSTGVNNVFLVENRSAIIYKKGNIWILEFYADNTLLQEELNIKF
jgi:hypothetical protein